MPKREDEFWASRKEPERTKYCPKCGSSDISYNEKFQSWRCNRCEHNFNIPSFESAGETTPKIPWDDKWFTINSEKQPTAIGEHEDDLEPEEEIVEEYEEAEQEYPETKIDVKISSKSKAWFGNEYFDKKTRKWKKPGTKASSVVISIIALILIIVIVVISVLYIFVFTKPVS